MKKFANSATLDAMDPGIYHVADIFNRIISSGASVATNWTGIKKQLGKKPEWHWNGLSAPGKSAWIKDVPKPRTEPKPVTAPIVVVQRVHDDDEPHQGPVITSLARIEGMVGTLCEQLGVKVTDGVANQSEDVCLKALSQVQIMFQNYKKGKYITIKKARAIMDTIDQALTKCGR